jgi:DNA topoisomerase I
MASRSTGGVASKLLIVESPAKIKTISKFLGSDFKIMSTVGHIKDLPEKTIGVSFDEKNPDGEIILEYVPIKGKEDVIASLAKQAGKSSEIYLASDPDREGEIISWHASQEVSKTMKDPSKIYRITFNEITATAIQEAINNKSVINQNMVEAQQARRVLDRWVGYEVSPILWRKIAKGTSAGRVQSVVVLLVCNREDEIVSFVPEESWSINGIFLVDKEKFSAALWKVSGKVVKLKNKEDADKVIKALNDISSFIVDSVTDKKRSKKPLAPFMTSSLQQDAYNKLGFAPERTMSLAQKLYEGQPLADKSTPEALITYMRTDSLRIADEALKDTRSYLKSEFGKEYIPASTQVYSKKGAQDAHEAIRPITVSRTPEFVSRHLDKDMAALYELIWRRFVACQMTPAIYAQRQVVIQGDKFEFKAVGSTLIFDGFLKIYKPEISDSPKEEDDLIPEAIVAKKELEIDKFDSKQHFTKPPARFTEATLIKEMEKQGIGRPSTYSATLATIQKRGYVEKDKKRFCPTELGRAVINLLLQHLADIVNVTFTAKMEEGLDKIALGKTTRDKVLHSFYKKFSKDLATFGDLAPGKTKVEIDVDCPKCKKSKLSIRFGKSGQFVGCLAYPECDFTSNFERDEKGEIKLVEAKGPEELDMDCPKCEKRKLVKRVGKFGPFIACPGFPECKYIHSDVLKMKCPNCKSEIKKRTWKKGVIWGCSSYPACKFGIFGDVEEKPCKKCKKPYLMINKSNDGSVVLTCPDKECDYSE